MTDQPKFHSVLSFLILFAFALLQGCSSKPKLEVTGDTVKPYDLALDAAFQEVEIAQRKPAASQISLKERLKFDLGRLQGSVQVAVFSKIGNLTSKKREAVSSNYAGPVFFEISAQRLLSCAKLKKETTPRWRIQEFFDQGASDQAVCGIFRVRPSGVRSRNFRKRSEVQEMRLYVSDDFRPHGLEVEFLEDGETQVSRPLKLDPEIPGGVSLAMFPVDLPILSQILQYEKRIVNLPQDPKFQSRFRKAKLSICEEGYQFSYRDAYGVENQVTWCEGSSWPSIVETPSYLAILKRS
jgi:hypothetical protein